MTGRAVAGVFVRRIRRSTTNVLRSEPEGRGAVRWTDQTGVEHFIAFESLAAARQLHLVIGEYVDHAESMARVQALDRLGRRDHRRHLHAVAK